MKVVDHLKREKFQISFEIIPPQRGGKIDSLTKVIEELLEYKPPFIDVTSHAAQIIDIQNSLGNIKKAKRKRPGTLGICALIQKKYNVDAVPHVLCEGFTKEETEDFLIEIHYLGIHNVLALRGDKVNYEKEIPKERSVNRFAVDLVKQIKDINKGIFLDNVVGERTDFCIGVAGYPEKHFEAPDLETDIKRLKEKVDQGADYIVTQMFFNNDIYFAFVNRCREAGITVPIIPGLKVISAKSQLRTLPEIFHTSIPEELYNRIRNSDQDKISQIGAEWAAKQVKELRVRGAPSVHFYVMQSAEPIHLTMNLLNVK